MNIIWLGHGSFRIEIAGQVLLIDPWLTGNPVLPEVSHEAAVAGATHILLTHAHRRCCSPQTIAVTELAGAMANLPE